MMQTASKQAQAGGQRHRTHEAHRRRAADTALILNFQRFHGLSFIYWVTAKNIASLAVAV
jgi:hypothetical protein